MAWKDVPAKDDPNLSFQAYYARPNVVQRILEPVSREVFRQIWAVAENDDLKGLRRSALVGFLMADYIRAIGLPEISETPLSPGDWFIHSGETHYSPLDGDLREARITSFDGAVVTGVTRTECNITSSASVNMSGVDDVSLVIGRLTTASKFDLVAAGYRDPMASLGGRLPRGSVADLSRMAEGKPWSSSLLRLQFGESSDGQVLRAAITDTVNQFSTAVTKQGAWKLLYGSDGKPLHERQHQGMFRLFSQLPFGALGIQVHPNTDHGSGPTDFTLRLNDSTNIVEFKKDDRREEIKHGMAIQLPNYMASAGADRGTYIVMCHHRKREDVEDILADVIVSDPTLPPIGWFVIDCTPKTSASKAQDRLSPTQ
ncbi:hypothetical protein ACFY2K_22635 [Kitasatospora sp. NPDC001309]|uniref:hypothetical protein n=1 Tax=Kitasatospora sp. NPDC001309 TaxID=3364013 RepID=UPI0036CE0403